jgi:Major Facilitator Superfamily
VRALLRHRDVRVFLVGWTISQFGDWALIIVLAVWAKALTGSNASAGLVFFALAAPSIFSPLAGVIVDRVRRRPLLVVVYSIEAIATLSLLTVHDRGDVWLLYAMAVFIGAFGTLAASARSGLMTTTIPHELLGDGNAIFQSVREGLRLIAPLVGAGIYAAAGGGVVAIVDAVSFVGVVGALLLMRTPEPRFERVEHNFMSEALAGARHIIHTIPLRQIVFSTGAALLVVGFSETIIFAVIDEGLHQPPSFLGVLSTLQGIGAIAGGLTAARGLRVLGDVRVAGIGMAGFAVGELSFVSSNLGLIAAGIIIAGFGVSWFIVGLMTALQMRTPLRLQGRVSSAADVFISTPQTVSIAVGAALIAVVDYRLLVGAESAAVALCAAYLLTRPAIVPAESPQAPSAEPLSQPQP